MKYRRAFIPGGTIFFTLVTYKRRPIFTTPEAIELLRNAFQYTQQRMPSGVSDFATRWRLIKSHFTRNWCAKGAISEVASRVPKGEKDVLQRRFWEHLIRDEQELIRHGEYIQYNPVKHGLLKSPSDWRYSSLMKYVQDGTYPPDWGGNGKIWASEQWME
jgi:putative transposase